MRAFGAHQAMVGVLLAASLASPAVAKAPPAADQAAVSEIVAKVYDGYTKPLPEAPEDGSYLPDNPQGAAIDGYEPPYSSALDALIQRWTPVGSGDELVTMNSFDWYCQCQDWSHELAKLVSQKYSAKGRDRIDAVIRFAPVGGKGAPLVFRFVRENGNWLVDDLKFEDGTTLRKGLLDDIADGAKSAN